MGGVVANPGSFATAEVVQCTFVLGVGGDGGNEGANARQSSELDGLLFQARPAVSPGQVGDAREARLRGDGLWEGGRTSCVQASYQARNAALQARCIYL